MLSLPVLLIVIRTSTSMSDPASVVIVCVGFASSVAEAFDRVGSVLPVATAGRWLTALAARLVVLMMPLPVMPVVIVGLSMVGELIVLFVSVSVVSRATRVRVPVGSVTVPELLMLAITGD